MTLKKASIGVLERTRSALLVFTVATSVAIVAQTWWAVEQDQQQTMASETTNGMVAVRLLEEHASQTLQDAVHTLDQVGRAVRPGRFDGPKESARIRKFVASHDLSHSRHLKALQYVSPDGISWISSPDYPTHQSSVAYRNDIQFLLSHPTHHGVVVGHPFASNYDSQWVIPVSRTLFDLSDRPVGVISVNVRLSYFGTLYSRVAKENRASVALFSDDGFVIVRSPFEARYVDRDISNEQIAKSLLSASSEGSFSDAFFLDDDEGLKLYAYRKIAEFPITAVYAREYDSVLTPWRERTQGRVLFAAGTLVLAAALTAFLLVYIRRLQSSQSSLKESESKFSSLFEQSPVASTLIRTADGRFVETNAAWLAQFGYQRDEVIGHTALELGMWVVPEDRKRLVDLLVHDHSVDKFEVRHRHKDGHEITCLMSGRILPSEQQLLTIFTLVDITQQRAVEQEIREINQQLEQRVLARTEKLEIANRELEQALVSVHAMQAELVRTEKMAALGSLVAGVAHELNTPIGNSVTIGSTLQHQISGIFKEFTDNTMRRSGLQEFLENASWGTEILMRSLTRAAELIGSFKRVAVDQSSDLRRQFDLPTVLREVCLTIEPMYKNKPYDLALDLSTDIEMDSFPGALGQLITNFVSNALQHGFEGRAHGHMQLRARATARDQVTIQFSDNGVGMSEDTRNRVFDPFFTTKLGQGGSGLGMNIAYNIVREVLGGTIDIQTAPGAGVEITVTIPRAAPQHQE